MYDLGRPLSPNYTCYEYDVTYENYMEYGFNACGSFAWASVYFVTWFVIFATIMLQLFLAIILKRFDDETKSIKPILSIRDLNVA